MISPRCFEEAWIRRQAASLRALDLRTLEKNILALELVSRLRREGLEFIFKGGTSLALFFDPVRRLSIDVDILSLEPIELLKSVLAQATTDRPPFTGYEHQERRDREAPPTVLGVGSRIVTCLGSVPASSHRSSSDRGLPLPLPDPHGRSELDSVGAWGRFPHRHIRLLLESDPEHL